MTVSSAAGSAVSVERRSVLVTALAWLVAWMTVSALIAAADYSSRDPDSQLYAALSARICAEPLERWIAPQWWGHWDLNGPYVEHPVGMFVVPAALGRLGYPRAQAAYAVNALYQVCVCVLVMQIAAVIVPRSRARALSWALQLMPIAFVFRVRANQEYAVLAGLLVALYATERTRHRAPWMAGMIGGFAAVLLVKGIFALMVPLVCGLWLVARGRSPRPWPAWLGVGLMPLVGVLLAWAYDAAYYRVTGQSFLDVYRRNQIPDAAYAGSILARTAYNATWYFTRVVWYAAPWSIPALLMAARQVWMGEWWPWTRRAPAGDGAARQGAWFAIAAGLALAAGFSFAHRKADRYIFPAYFLIGAAGAAATIHWSPRLARLVDRLDRPWVPAVIYLGLVLLTLATSGKLPVFTYWRT